MKDVKLVFEDSRIMEIYRGTTVREVLKEINDDSIIALRVNGELVDADYEINEDAYVKYILASDKIGQKIYIKGLQYVYILAVKELFGSKAVVNIKHALDKAIYTEIQIKKDVNRDVVLNIKKKMKEICNRDIPFRRVNVDKEDAYEYVSSLEEEEKVLNYTYMTNDTVTLYELDNEYNYFYYVMPPSTGLLKRFDLSYVSPNGIALSYPQDNIIPKFSSIPKVLDAFKEYDKKLTGIGVKFAGDLNKMIVEGKISDFIQQNEILYNQNLIDIANKVVNNKNIKSIFISGPSSSGKTTTSKKIAMCLHAMGKEVLVISTDDYFLEREDTPKKPDGTYEFESVDALDVKLFNTQMKALLDGKAIVMPTFNFITGKKEYKKPPIKLEKNQILVVEGLHAISEKLNHSIPKKNKLRLYISPFTPIRLDRHNHISTTDVRLLRRLVRDYRTRGYSAEQTLTNWASMRDSEGKYVYPHQREADIVINTALAYEIGVLRTYAEPLLYSIDKGSANYEEAIRILNFLKGFLNIPSEYVPNVSVLREFVGNSYYE